jgi:hypothetical protein
MDNDPKVRKGANGKKKDQKEKGKSQTLGSKKHVRLMEALLEKRKNK